MTTTYKQDGNVIQHTTGSNIAAGQIVKIGNLLGVALTAIPSGGTGPVQLSGVFAAPKVTASVIAKGETVVWDASAASGAGAFGHAGTTLASGDISGAAAVAWEAAGNGATTLLVKLTGVPGTLTA